MRKGRRFGRRDIIALAVVLVLIVAGVLSLLAAPQLGRATIHFLPEQLALLPPISPSR